MGETMSVDTLTAPAASLEEERRDESGQRSIVLALLTMAVVLDQATKWWGWRHVPAIINGGGDWLVGSRVGEWYAGPVSGALLDLLDFGLVGIAAYVLIRHRRPTLVLISGALLVGGWGSNLLDRLAIHHVTAPGSGRGAVDFIQLGGQYYNVADFLIAIATPLLLLALGYQGWRATDRPVTPWARWARTVVPIGDSVSTSGGTERSSLRVSPRARASPKAAMTAPSVEFTTTFVAAPAPGPPTWCGVPSGARIVLARRKSDGSAPMKMASRPAVASGRFPVPVRRPLRRRC